MANNKNEEKKVRAPNFTVREKEILFDLVSSQKLIIENKKTDSVTFEQKKEAWNKISQDFNVLSPAIFPRSVESLKKFYNNKKEELRKNLAMEKRELYRTGGGLPPAHPPRDGADQFLANIINQKTLFGVPTSIAPFDDDYQDDDNTCIDEDRENVNMEFDSHSKNTEGNNSESTSWAKPSISKLTSNQSQSLLSSVNKIQKSFQNQQNIEVIMESDQVFEFEDSDPEHLDISRISKNEEKGISQLPQLLKMGTPNKKMVKDKKKTIDKTRRRPAGRPAPTVRTLSSSRLGELYENLVEKKTELVVCLIKEHEARMNILELDKKIKEKQLANLMEEGKKSYISSTTSSISKKSTASSSINDNGLSEFESTEMV